MKRRTKLILILSTVLVVVITVMFMHFRVRRQFTNYLLQRYPSENFSIDYVSYGLLPLRAVAQSRTASDDMPFEVTGQFEGLGLTMTLTDNYYVSRSEVFFSDRLDPVMQAYGSDIYDYTLTIRQDMAPVQAASIPIYPFELHIVLGEDVDTPSQFVEKVAQIASELDAEDVSVMEIMHFVSVPVRPEQELLEPFGLDIGLMEVLPTPTPEQGAPELTTVPADGTDESQNVEPLTTHAREYTVDTDMMFEIYLDRGDKPFVPAVVQNGMRIVPVNRRRLTDLGLKALPQVEADSATIAEATER